MLFGATTVVIIGTALVLIVVGLLMCYLRTAVTSPVLQKIVYVVGIVLVVVGLIFLLFPVLAWVHAQLTAMFG